MGFAEPMRAHLPQHISQLQTPCLIVDTSKMTRNVARATGRLTGSDTKLRPHLKTVKSVDAISFTFSGRKIPATVSTLKEASEFGSAGYRDLLYAVAVSPQKLQQVHALRRTGVDLKIVVDSISAAHAVANSAAAEADPLPVLIELDVDGHRSGIGREDAGLLVQIGTILNNSAAELAGVITHAGESYGTVTDDGRAQAALIEQQVSVELAQTLRGANLPCPIVSIGSTPTLFSNAPVDGVTEIRAGVYMFFDLVQAGIGVCTEDDIALSVLATVIGHQQHKNWIITDAGWMALSTDRGTSSQQRDQGYGVVCDETGRPFEDLIVVRANQEHGIIARRPGTELAEIPDLPLGTRLRILPNHACATAAQHASYNVVDTGGNITAVWPRFGGW